MNRIVIRNGNGNGNQLGLYACMLAPTPGQPPSHGDGGKGSPKGQEGLEPGPIVGPLISFYYI